MGQARGRLAVENERQLELYMEGQRCFTCILSCPYGAIEPDETGHVMQKCELCTKNGAGEPLCVKNCPNQAIVYDER